MTTTAESLVTSLEISQRFAELGVPQGQSYFVWVLNGKEYCVWDRYEANFCNNNAEYSSNKIEILCDAFTLSELVIMQEPSKYCPFPYKVEDMANTIISRIKQIAIDPKDLKL